MAAGYPTKPTWLLAICKSFFAAWPLLTEHAIIKHFPKSTEMAKGHMHQQQQGLTSMMPNDNNNHNQPQIQKEQDTYSQVYDTKNIMCIDQTGAFSIQSSQGNRYIIILCEINNNKNLVEPMKNKSSGKMNKTFKKLMNWVKAANIYPNNTS